VFRFPSVMHEQIHSYGYKYFYRVTPKCAHRVVYRGYMHNPKNKSLGSNLDFVRAFLGLQSPMLEEVNEIKKNINY